jgi:probable addiction module antidote protein
MEGNDPKHIACAKVDVAGSKGMTEITKKTGIGRQALCTALSENGNPKSDTLMAVLDALRPELTVQKRQP